MVPQEDTKMVENQDMKRLRDAAIGLLGETKAD
jgi:hypothetical protein